MPVLPLFIDVVYIFMQRVNPPHLFDHLNQKLKRMEKSLDFRIVKWHLWCLDKSYVICELKIRSEKSGVKDMVRQKLTKKWCQDVVIELN